MKKTFLFIAATVFALSFTSCSKDKDEDEKKSGETKEAYIDATSNTIWQYYSLAENKLIGSAEGNDENDALWAERKDWDIAIRKMYVRTNSGTSTTVSANGGLYTFDANTNFNSVVNLPAADAFVSDAIVTYAGMGGNVTTSQSAAKVVQMKKGEDGTTIMPPIYVQTPVYIFRTADGSKYYKVQFTQYKNEDDVAGHVKFNVAQIYKN